MAQLNNKSFLMTLLHSKVNTALSTTWMKSVKQMDELRTARSIRRQAKSKSFEVVTI
jgi:hypothetical protein